MWNERYSPNEDAKKIFDPKKSHFESKEEMKPEENKAKRLQKKRI